MQRHPLSCGLKDHGGAEMIQTVNKGGEHIRIFGVNVAKNFGGASGSDTNPQVSQLNPSLGNWMGKQYEISGAGLSVGLGAGLVGLGDGLGAGLVGLGAPASSQLHSQHTDFWRNKKYQSDCLNHTSAPPAWRSNELVDESSFRHQGVNGRFNQHSPKSHCSECLISHPWCYCWVDQTRDSVSKTVGVNCDNGTNESNVGPSYDTCNSTHMSAIDSLPYGDITKWAKIGSTWYRGGKVDKDGNDENLSTVATAGCPDVTSPGDEPEQPTITAHNCVVHHNHSTATDQDGQDFEFLRQCLMTRKVSTDNRNKALEILNVLQDKFAQAKDTSAPSSSVSSEATTVSVNASGVDDTFNSPS